MGRRLENKQIYPFAWLDEVVEVTLNPKKGNIDQLHPDELHRLRDKFRTTVWQVLESLKAQTFWILSIKKRKALVQQYGQSIQLLKQQAVLNLENHPANSPLGVTGNAIIIHLDELSDAIAKRYTEYATETATTDNMPSAPDIYKIICELSIDQIGIILKAADDIKLIVSRSLSMVFKSIVPYLSTRNKKELSWDSMRSNSYHPEERDKEAAIAALEKMIRKIREYK